MRKLALLVSIALSFVCVSTKVSADAYNSGHEKLYVCKYKDWIEITFSDDTTIHYDIIKDYNDNSPAGNYNCNLYEILNDSYKPCIGAWSRTEKGWEQDRKNGDELVRRINNDPKYSTALMAYQVDDSSKSLYIRFWGYCYADNTLYVTDIKGH